MKRRPVDYSGFKLNRLNEPRFSHIKLLGGWLLYLIMYCLTENLIPQERCHVIHGFLDDRIPFLEGFVIIYCAWYFIVAGSLAYTLFYDVDKFKKLQKYLMITQAIAMVCYICYPTMQDLRPAVFPRQNVFTWVLGIIYSIDTPTGVCPSMHVAFSIAILSTALKDNNINSLIKAALAIFSVLVCMAVCFVKQHSSIDVVTAFPVCLVAEVIVYGRNYWMQRFRRITMRSSPRRV